MLKLSSLIPLLALPFLLFPHQGAEENDPPRFSEAVRLFAKHDLEGADKALGALLASKPDPDVLVRAERFKALLAWRYRQDEKTARLHLDRALASEHEISATLAENARMETALGNYASAVDSARRAAELAVKRDHRLRAAEELASAAAANARARLENGTVPSSLGSPGGSLDDQAVQWLREANSAVQALLPEHLGRLKLSRLGFVSALLLGDGPAARRAWRSYYFLIVENQDAKLLSGPREVLDRILPAWTQEPLSGSEAKALLVALARSAFYQEAALVLRSSALTADQDVREDPEVLEIAAYGRFLDELKTITDEFYRRTSLGKGDRAAWREAVDRRAAELWKRLRWPGPPPDYTRQRLNEEADRRFAATISWGRTAGYWDVHWGHRVVDESIRVSQYGRAADLRFTSLDSMASNGFQSWAWDTKGSHGGWSRSADSIVQVRTSFAEGPREAWRLLTDPEKIEELDKRIARDSAADWEKAARDPYAYLPSLTALAAQEGRIRLRDALAAQGIGPAELEKSFLREYRQAVLASNIMNHEGRHAIDQSLGLSLQAWEGEFRAKLSEVALAPRPFLALDGILSATIGDSTPHGRANLQVMKGLVAWMRSHAEAIDGLDKSRPLLPQLPQLSDEQLRAAFRSMDPFAQEGRNSPRR